MSPAPQPPRYAELWAAMKTRLDSATMQRILGAAGRIYAGHDDYSQPEGAENAAWGRVVIEGGRTLWPMPEQSSAVKVVRFRLVSEMNDYTAAGYNVLVDLEGAQQEAYRLLQHWTPTGFTRLRLGFEVWREEGPGVQPEWDEGRHLWWMSSLYRCEAASVVLA